MKKLLLIYLSLVSIIIPGKAFAQLTMVADGSADFSAHEKYCAKVGNITQDTADNLAESLKVSSDSIDFRSSRLAYSACCVTMDTPKGPIRRLAWQFYQNKEGRITVRINTINVKDSDPMC